MALFFGSTKEIAAYNSVRKEVLLRSPRGSPSFTMNKALDEGAPAEWTPRPADEKEEAEVQEIREMQELVRRHLGERKEININDMSAILGGFGNRWADKLQVYQDAINTMDQGVML